ncbi:MAG: glycosyltransferase family 1 protein [Gemmatimonadetes bacterium]|nr:glycosyltransferase family 1 protein [Gemmatimonadota bacterium]
MPLLRQKISVLPPRLEGLAALATNLSWSWNREARDLLRTIDPPLWRETRHNPIEMLREVPPSRLEKLAHDPTFLARYDRVMTWMAGDRQHDRTWFGRRNPDVGGRPIAYFCAEFGLHNSVPIYSGGLGILAGDHCKTASDLGLPFVGIGLSYMKGYFDQRLRADGWQEDSDDHVDPIITPLVELRGDDGQSHLTVVETFGRPVYVRVWTMKVGRVPLYLLDTNLESNHPEDRALLSKLYAGGPDLRLRQEWLLGVGGVRVLRAVGLDPGVWHANEGHAAFMMLERVRELTVAGMPFAEAVAEIRSTSVFTTHTPVPAGHDAFDVDHLVACTGPVWDEMGIDQETFLDGRRPNSATTWRSSIETRPRLRCSPTMARSSVGGPEPRNGCTAAAGWPISPRRSSGWPMTGSRGSPPSPRSSRRYRAAGSPICPAPPTVRWKAGPCRPGKPFA